MKAGEKGFTLIELLIAATIMALAGAAAGAATIQIMRNMERNSDYMTAVSQVQNAGYHISSDAQMALGVTSTGNLTSPDFLVLGWTTWNATSGNPVYHSATYFFEGLADGVGTLKRNYWSSDGANQTSQIAQYIYYDPADTVNTSNASYQSPVLTVRLTASFGEFLETREYRNKRRTNLF